MGRLQGAVFKNIIVRMPNWIGDMVMATPVLADLRKTYPEASITAMCRSPLSDLLKYDPNIDKIFCFSKPKSFSRREETKDIVDKLRKSKYDLGILLTHSLSSSWWFWRGHIHTRIGYDCNGRRFLLTDAVEFPQTIEQQHLVLTYKMLLEPLGISLSKTVPQITVAKEEVIEARASLGKYGWDSSQILVGINPGATYGSAKCWLPARFREVTRRLLSHPEIFIVFFGDTSTASLVKEICPDAEGRVINLAGLTSLREVAALISLCNVLLTNDSGPMHIADAVGTKIVALFGSTNEIVTGPYRPATIFHKHVACSPCYQRTCPIDFRCMRQIQAEEVYEALIGQLELSHSKLHVIA